ncbi:hypothetical protein MU582_02085 [Nocardioidaceae bacterium SCSIO 66511]|nr:hypothetical protein MU582_02085 [Nocardioidaceae bacterium SCSIO 66511]
MTQLQPFDKHQADTADLEACGANLITQAADGITTGKLTKKAYSPAIPAMRGDCAPLVQSADNAVQQGSQTVTGELAWAAVVTKYWSTQVIDFNSRVDTITSTLAEAEKNSDGEGDDDPDSDSPRVKAKRDWWTAYYNYIETGQSEVSAMLRDGPTKAHMQTVIDAGAMPGMTWDYATSWDDFKGDFAAGFMGIWTPPADPGDYAVWYGKLVGLIGSWTGHGVNKFATQRYMPLPGLGGNWYSRFNPNNWQQRYNMSRYGWSRTLWPWTSRSPLPYNLRGGRFDKWKLPFRREMAPVTKWSKLAGVADKGFYALSFAGGAYDQWGRDSQRTDLSTGAKVTRSATRGTVKLAGTYAGIETGAYVGAYLGSFGGPIGTVAGSMVGGIVGGVIGSGVADEAADYVVEGVTDAYDATADAVDTAKDWTGDRLDDAGDVVKKLKFW